MKPPTRLWRVTWDAAVGWPFPERRQQTSRNYASDTAAGRQVAIIAAMPSHLALVSVHVSDEIAWTEIDPASLPSPEVETNDDDD